MSMQRFISKMSRPVTLEIPVEQQIPTYAGPPAPTVEKTQAQIDADFRAATEELRYTYSLYNIVVHSKNTYSTYIHTCSSTTPLPESKNGYSMAELFGDETQNPFVQPQRKPLVPIITNANNHQ